MDAEANLKEQMALCECISKGDHDESDVDRLVELVLELDEWIANGGYLPARWRPAEDRKLAATLRAALKLDRQNVKPSEVSAAHSKFRALVDRLIRL